MTDLLSKVDYQQLQVRIHQACQRAAWEKDWANGGVYLHLEASELIEALRGKGSDPTEEGGDVLFTLCALLSNYNIKLDDCARALMKKMDEKGQ